MIKCPSCGASHPDNTLFCEECGIFLAGQSDHSTARLPTEGPAETAPSAPRRSSTIILAIQHGSRIALPMTKEIVLGRLDASKAIFPDVDLTNEGGLESGVSRRHARIFRTEAGLVIEDLDSLNGTFLNGTRLTPAIPYPMNDGDRIQIGTLVLTIHVR